MHDTGHTVTDGCPSGWFDAVHRGTWAGPSTPLVLLSLAAVACAAYGAWLAWLAVTVPADGNRGRGQPGASSSSMTMPSAAKTGRASSTS